MVGDGINGVSWELGQHDTELRSIRATCAETRQTIDERLSKIEKQLNTLVNAETERRIRQQMRSSAWGAAGAAFVLLVRVAWAWAAGKH